MSIEIRPLRSEDFEETIKCVHYASELNKKDYPPDFIDYVNQNWYTTDWIEKQFEGGEFYVAVLDGKIVGTVNSRDNKITNVFVNYDFQGEGIGKALMDFKEKEIAEIGFDTIRLNCNLTSKGFYLNRGYEVVDELVDEIQGWQVTGFAMEKKLEQ